MQNITYKANHTKHGLHFVAFFLGHFISTQYNIQTDTTTYYSILEEDLKDETAARQQPEHGTSQGAGFGRFVKLDIPT